MLWLKAGVVFPTSVGPTCVQDEPPLLETSTTTRVAGFGGAVGLAEAQGGSRGAAQVHLALDGVANSWLSSLK